MVVGIDALVVVVRLRALRIAARREVWWDSKSTPGPVIPHFAPSFP